MKKRRQWTTYSGSGKRVAPRTRTSRVSRGKEMGVPRLWVQLIVCGALFVALIGLKLLMPGNLSALRGTLGQWLVRDADFISAFSAVGRAASGEQDWGDSLSEAYVAVFGGESKAQEVSGNLIGMTVSEQDVSDLTSARELPALAVGEQRILGFSYTTPLSGTVTSPHGGTPMADSWAASKPPHKCRRSARFPWSLSVRRILPRFRGTPVFWRKWTERSSLHGRETSWSQRSIRS